MKSFDKSDLYNFELLGLIPGFFRGLSLVEEALILYISSESLFKVQFTFFATSSLSCIGILPFIYNLAWDQSKSPIYNWSRVLKIGLFRSQFY